MPAPRHLREAPITEAIIDVRVKARSGFQPREFEKIKPEVSRLFPESEEQTGGVFTFQLAPTGVQPPVVQDLGFQGYVFRTTDKKLLAQFRADGFTLNRLRPYTSWEELFPIALDLWKLYCSAASPEGVSRLAVRYINRIVLPSDLGEFSRYLRAAPVVPEELPQTVTAFQSRTTIQDTGRGLAAHVAQAFGTDAESQKTLILDIDAFCEGAWAPSDPEIAGIFGRLREFKDLIFFNSLTDETLRQFE
jgi:uncharacterized protein (TIGR04255 family)